MVIIALNEQERIGRALCSVEWAHERIVVDGGSQDATVEIARKHGAKVMTRPFDDFSSQKNFAIEQAAHEWVLLLDADEVVTPALQAEIQALSPDPTRVCAYFIRRRNYYMEHRVRFSGWQNDRVLRLFHKTFCRYDGKKVHEQLVANGPTGRLTAPMEHYTYRDFASILTKIDQYSSYKAHEKMRNRRSVSLAYMMFKPLAKFFIHYFWRLGILDGRVGFIISALSAYDVGIRCIKMWRISRGERFIA